MKGLNTTIYVLTLLFSVLTFYVAYWIPKRILIYQIISDLLKEYRTPEFNFAIKSIRKFYSEKCNNDPSKIVRVYNNICRYEKKNQLDPKKYKYSLDSQKRIVSQFYQQFANLRYTYNYICKNEFKKTIKSIFSSEDLEIIQIVYIIEKHKSTKCNNKRIGKLKEIRNINVHDSLENILRFYEEYS